MELFETARQVEEDLTGISRKIHGRNQDPSGPVRVTCTEILLNGYLAPSVWSFLQEHRGIELSITCTRSQLSLSRSDADIALRFTSNPPETLVGRRLVSVAYAAYGAEARLACLSDGEEASSTLEWIGLPDDHYNRMMYKNGLPEGQIKHRVDSMEAIQSMVRQGLGVSLLPCYTADRDPALRRLDGYGLFDIGLDLWILYHPEVRRVQRVRLFADFVSNLIANDRDLFEGRRPQGLS